MKRSLLIVAVLLVLWVFVPAHGQDPGYYQPPAQRYTWVWTGYRWEARPVPVYPPPALAVVAPGVRIWLGGRGGHHHPRHRRR